MIVQVQAISKILAKRDYSFIEDNLLTEDLFIGYESEYQFIIQHYEKYGVIPDELTFREKFPNFEVVEVAETDQYIVDTLREVGLYTKSVAVFQKAAELLKTDSNEAVQFLRSQLDSELMTQYTINDVELLSDVFNRVHDSEYVGQNSTDFFIPTGLTALDNDINGFKRGDELVVIVARINQGKSWVSEKIASYMAEIGYKVGYFSPEMSAKDLGYRFDTLHGNLSNNTIRLGRFTDELSLLDYKDYAETLRDLEGKLYVTRPKHFARKVTISKLRNWINFRKLDALFIDGITYLTDERYKRGDSKTTSLTNISEDLMELSTEMKIPIIVVVQANRSGVVEKNSLDTPELENIRDSDGIAMNASIVYAMRQIKDKDGDTYLLIDNKKMRAGEVGKSYRYKWNIDIGEFEYVVDIDMPEDDNTSEPKKLTAGKKNRGRKAVEDEY